MIWVQLLYVKVTDFYGSILFCCRNKQVVIYHFRGKEQCQQFTHLSIRPAAQCQCLLNKGVKVDVGVWQQLPENHIIVQVTAENRCRKRQRRAQLQGLKNVLLHILGRRRCQRQAGDPQQASTQLAQFEVVRPKIMAPLGDAVSLIHCQVGQQAAGAQACQAGLERRRSHHLWSDVEELQLRAAALQVSQDQTALACWQLGVDGAGRDVQVLQVVHLVLQTIGNAFNILRLIEGVLYWSCTIRD